MKCDTFASLDSVLFNTGSSLKMFNALIFNLMDVYLFLNFITIMLIVIKETDKKDCVCFFSLH